MWKSPECSFAKQGSKNTAYRRSLSTLRSINKAEAQRKVDLAKLFEVYDTCVKHIAAELEFPHLSKIDKADALISSITATDILLNELGLEEAPLRELIKQLGNRRLGTPDIFSFDQATRPNAVGFDEEVIRALIFALYEEKGPRVGQTEAVSRHPSSLRQDCQAKLLQIDHFHPQTVPVSLQPVGQGSGRSGSL